MFEFYFETTDEDKIKSELGKSKPFAAIIPLGMTIFMGMNESVAQIIRQFLREIDYRMVVLWMK